MQDGRTNGEHRRVGEGIRRVRQVARERERVHGGRAGRATFYVGCTRAIQYLEVFAHLNIGLAREAEQVIGRRRR